MLTFISFWRAASIVLCDLASSAYYAGGIAEGAVGRSAPWFILGVMLFSFAVRAVYVESCTMFTRGGVYRVVKEALGGTAAKLSVSALMFDYVLTGPISGVSAGQYIVGLMNELLGVFATHGWLPAAMMNAHGQPTFQFPINETSAFFAPSPTATLSGCLPTGAASSSSWPKTASRSRSSNVNPFSICRGASSAAGYSSNHSAHHEPVLPCACFFRFTQIQPRRKSQR